MLIIGCLLMSSTVLEAEQGEQGGMSGYKYYRVPCRLPRVQSWVGGKKSYLYLRMSQEELIKADQGVIEGWRLHWRIGILIRGAVEAVSRGQDKHPVGSSSWAGHCRIRFSMGNKWRNGTLGYGRKLWSWAQSGKGTLGMRYRKQIAKEGEDIDSVEEGNGE